MFASMTTAMLCVIYLLLASGMALASDCSKDNETGVCSGDVRCSWDGKVSINCLGMRNLTKVGGLRVPDDLDLAMTELLNTTAALHPDHILRFSYVGSVIGVGFNDRNNFYFADTEKTFHLTIFGNLTELTLRGEFNDVSAMRHSMVKLETLDLSDNLIYAFEMCRDDELPSVRILNLQRNDMHYLRSIEKCSSLEQLYIADNNIGFESTAAFYLSSPLVNLTTLDARRNILENFNLKNILMPNLRRLDLCDNKISSMIGGDYPKLTELRIAGNELWQVHSLFDDNCTQLASTKFPRLRELDVSRNKFRGFDFSTCFPRLEILSASENQITRYPTETWSRLKRLHLDGNPLSSPYDLALLMPKLVILDVRATDRDCMICQYMNVLKHMVNGLMRRLGKDNFATNVQLGVCNLPTQANDGISVRSVDVKTILTSWKMIGSGLRDSSNTSYHGFDRACWFYDCKFMENNITCKDKDDDCKNDACGKGRVCTNKEWPENFACNDSCMPDYKTEMNNGSVSCKAINHCNIELACGIGNKTCKFNDPGYTCTCKHAFQKNQHGACTIDLCGECNSNASCDELGTCRCKEGFLGNGKYCLPLSDYTTQDEFRLVGDGHCRYLSNPQDSASTEIGRGVTTIPLCKQLCRNATTCDAFELELTGTRRCLAYQDKGSRMLHDNSDGVAALCFRREAPAPSSSVPVVISSTAAGIHSSSLSPTPRVPSLQTTPLVKSSTEYSHVQQSSSKSIILTKSSSEQIEAHTTSSSSVPVSSAAVLSSAVLCPSVAPRPTDQSQTPAQIKGKSITGGGVAGIVIGLIVYTIVVVAATYFLLRRNYQAVHSTGMAMTNKQYDADL